MTKSGEPHTVVSRFKYTDDIDTEETFLLRQPCESFTYEVKNIAKRNELYTISDFIHIDWNKQNLLAHQRTLYYNSSLNGALPLCYQAFPSFVYESYAQIYKGNEYKEIFEGRVSEQMLLDSHYEQEADGTWWVRSGHAEFLADGEDLSDARQRFYVPVSFEDAFGAVTSVEYYKDYYLFICKITNAIGLSVEAQKFNFRTLQPEVMVDINGNKSQTILDELGFVKASAILGKVDDADNLNGYSEITSFDEQELINKLLVAEDSIEISSIAKKLLMGASKRYVYDTDAYMRCGKPLTNIVITREQQCAKLKDSPVQIAYSYIGGLGSTVLEKVQAENKVGAKKPQGSFRWLGNGRTILNNKGNALMTFEPYFSETPAYEDDSTVRELGVSSVMHYDAFGRMMRTDFPDGTFQKQDFDAWSVTSYDAGDCVLESDWYKQHKNDNAGRQSEIYAATPSTVYFDTLGQPAVMIDRLRETVDGPIRLLKTIAKRNIQGDIIEVTDARGNSAAAYQYDMLRRPLYENCLDRGQRWMITDMAGKIVYSWDECNHRFEIQYDSLQRPILAITHDLKNAKDYITSRIVYGDQLLKEDRSNIDELQQRNVLAMAIKNYDTAGLVETYAYDFLGMPLQTERRLAKKYKQMVNWTMESLDNDLEKRSYKVSMMLDALGRIMVQTSPDGTRTNISYNEGALMASQRVLFADGRKVQTPIKNISYNAKRQREHVLYGNGVSVKYAYDEKTFRVTRIFSCRKDGSILQDLNYTYDVVGRIVKIQDKNITTKFFDGKRIVGESIYTYDSLGRLLSASGRENDAALKFASSDNHSDITFQKYLHKGDSMALHNYTQQYTYDDANNILQMKHVSSGNNWTRNYKYEKSSNRLLSTRVGEHIYKYAYNSTHGFMTSMPHLVEIGWDAMERIAFTSKQERRNGGTPEITYYQYDSEGQRVRKVTECQTASGSTTKLKYEHVYLGSYEQYICHFGSNKGLIRDTISVLDGGHRYVMFEVRNAVNDGTAKELTRYRLDNHQGSACLELDEQAIVLSYEEYHPYGTTAYQAKNKAIKAAAKRYRYTGMERDEETGLNYHSARYYITWLGRWISCDPIGICGGMNLYCYCGNEPVNMLDMTGNYPIDAPINRPPVVAFTDRQPTKEDWLFMLDFVTLTIPGIVTIKGGITGVRVGVELFKYGNKAKAASIFTAEALVGIGLVDDTYAFVDKHYFDGDGRGVGEGLVYSGCNYITDSEHETACSNAAFFMKLMYDIMTGRKSNKMESKAVSFINKELKDNRKQVENLTKEIKSMEANYPIDRAKDEENLSRIMSENPQVGNDSLQKIINMQFTSKPVPRDKRQKLNGMKTKLSKSNESLEKELEIILESPNWGYWYDQVSAALTFISRAKSVREHVVDTINVIDTINKPIKEAIQ